jgi:hypothetical protein
MMTTNDFDALPKGKVRIEKIISNPNTCSFEEIEAQLKVSKFDPSYKCLKLILNSLELILISEKECIKRLDRIEELIK